MSTGTHGGGQPLQGRVPARGDEPPHRGRHQRRELAYSDHARRYLLATGCVTERTYVTGSPMAEVLRTNLAAIDASDVLEREGLEPGGYFLLSAHREENIDTEANFTSLFGAINALAEEYGKSILYSCHPPLPQAPGGLGLPGTSPGAHPRAHGLPRLQQAAVQRLPRRL